VPAANPAKLGNLTSTRLKPVILLAVCGFALVVSIIVLTTALISHLHNRALSDGERELKNTALILAEYTDRALESIELAQKSFLDRMQSAGITSSEQLRQEMSSETIHQLLKDKISGFPHIGAVLLTRPELGLLKQRGMWP
jgi:uncharacterized membrane protein (DUF106 family)